MKIILVTLSLLLSQSLLAQNFNANNSIDQFLGQKDSLVAYLLKGRINTKEYRCALQESTGIYVFISEGKCFVYSRLDNKMDSLSNDFIFEIPLVKSIGKEIVDSLIRRSQTEQYSPLGSIYYFESTRLACNLSFYFNVATFNRDLRTKKFSNNFFDLFGFARIKLNRL